MLGLIGLLLVLFLLMAGAFAFIGLSLQTRLFDQAPEGIYWQAPAAAAMVTSPLVLWTFWTLASPGDTRPLQQAPLATQTEAFKKIQVVTLDDRLETYALVPGGNPSVPRYRNKEDASRPLPTVMKEIRVPKTSEDQDCSVVFKHEKASGQAKESYINDSGRYVDEEGRIMERGTLGVILPSRTAKFLVLLLMYGLLFAAWLASFTFLVQLPGGYGIGLGLGGAILTNFTILPYLINFAERVSTR